MQLCPPLSITALISKGFPFIILFIFIRLILESFVKTAIWKVSSQGQTWTIEEEKLVEQNSLSFFQILRDLSEDPEMR